jgi:hypothetical protein
MTSSKGVKFSKGDDELIPRGEDENGVDGTRAAVASRRPFAFPPPHA